MKENHSNIDQHKKCTDPLIELLQMQTFVQNGTAKLINSSSSLEEEERGCCLESNAQNDWKAEPQALNIHSYKPLYP